MSEPYGYITLNDFFCTETEHLDGFTGTDIVAVRRNSFPFSSFEEFYLFGCTYDGIEMELPVGVLPEDRQCGLEDSACGPEDFNSSEDSFPLATGVMYNPKYGSSMGTLQCPEGATMVIRTRMGLPLLQFRTGMSFRSTVQLELSGGCQLMDYAGSPPYQEAGDPIEIRIASGSFAGDQAPSPAPVEVPSVVDGGTRDDFKAFEPSAASMLGLYDTVWFHAALLLFWAAMNW